MKKKLKIIIPVVLGLVVVVAAVAGFLFMDGKTFETGRCVMTTGGMCIWIDEEGNPIVLHDQSADGDLFLEITSGDTIRFVRDREIMESYPAQTNAYLCWKTGDGTLTDIPADVLANLTRTGWIPAE